MLGNCADFQGLCPHPRQATLLHFVNVCASGSYNKCLLSKQVLIELLLNTVTSIKRVNGCLSSLIFLKAWRQLQVNPIELVLSARDDRCPRSL